MIRSLRLAAVACLLATLTACGSADPKENMVAMRGWEVEVKSTVALKKPFKEGDETLLLTTTDAEVTKLLENGKGLVTGAVARYDQTRREEQTAIDPALVEVVLENYAVTAVEKSAVRKEIEDKKPRFNFTLRRAKARIVPEPVRIEVTMTVVENSRAPGDTVTFSQDFRAEILDRVNERVYQIAEERGLGPERPRPAQAPR